MKKSKFVLALLLSISTLSSFAVALNKSENYQTAEAASHPNNYNSYTYSGSYYDNITATGEGLNGSLRTALSSYIKPKSTYTYGGSGDTHLSSVLQKADEDPTNSSNMIYLYTRDSVKKNAASSWNREHVWPQSLSNDCWGTGGAGSDLLHIRPTYNNTNSTRGNDKYADCDGGSQLTYNGMAYGWSSGSYFEPLDSVKGDVARICMYVWVAWKNNYSNLPAVTSVFKNYDTLLKWHMMDAPDVMEGNRNNYSEKSIQKNRNPFVDHPEYAWMIFGDSASASVKEACKETYPAGGGYVPPTPDKTVSSIQISGTAAKLNYYTGETFNPNGITVTATYSDNSTATIPNSSCTWTPNPLTKGTTQVTCSYQGKTATYGPISVTDRPTLSKISITGTASKLSYYTGETFNSNGLTVTATYSDNNTSTIPNSSCTWTPNPLTKGTTQVTCNYQGLSTTYGPISVIDKPASGDGSYTLVSSVSELDDATVLIGSKAYGAVAGKLSSSVLESVEASFLGNGIKELPNDAWEFSVKKNGSNYNFVSPSGQLGCTSEKNLSIGNGVQTWSVSISSGKATITPSSGSYGSLQYNKDHPRFTTYKSSQQSIELYKKTQKEDPNIVHVQSLSLNATEETIDVGEQVILSATILPSNASNQNILWSTNDINIANVNNGVVTGLKGGETLITATTVDGNHQATCLITVKGAEIPITSVKLSQNTLSLKKGESATLIATILPNDATNKDVIWSSSDESVVKVDNGTLTALNVGESTIKVTTVDGNLQDICTVTVTDSANQKPDDNEKGCDGSIVATSAILSITALIGLSLISFKKKED